MEILAVKDIDVVLVDDKYVEICKYAPEIFDIEKDLRFPTKAEFEVSVEAVRGKIFINTRGEKFCIGMSKQVQEAIGLPFEVFENQERMININISEIMDLNEKLEKFKTMSFWKRLKFLFKGEKYNA